MGKLCILTDDTAEFPHPHFAGRENLYTFPVRNLPPSPNPNSAWTRAFLRQIDSLCKTCTEILVLPSANAFGNLADSVRGALEERQGCAASILVLDTQTIGPGIGFLAQRAAAFAEEGLPLTKTAHRIRAAVPHLYTLLFVPKLSRLARQGHLSPAQAAAGEILGLLPLFILEKKRVAPLRKARTWRHLINEVLEFIEEFESPIQISLIQPQKTSSPKRPSLRAALRKSNPAIPLWEHRPHPLFTATLGASATGIILVENDPTL